jgi:pyruvate-formate lyase-activating enzyme
MADAIFKKETKPEISFSWNIHFKCNYRCPYCWFHGQWQTFSKYNHSFRLEEIVKSWKDIYEKYGTVHIDILGGEPFLYPGFLEIVKELSQTHSINISTNLSVNIERFVAEVNPLRVKILPSFHPLFADLDDFFKNLSLLRGHGFQLSVSYLAYPPQLKLLEFYKEKFKSMSFSLGVKSFWGQYNGKEYPRDYTDEERKMIAIDIGSRAGEQFQIKPRKIKKGSLCRAGQIYAVIQADGKVQKCGMDDFNGSLGNFFEGTFKLLKSPCVCNSEHCPCNEWAFLLIEKGSASSVEEQYI